MSRYYINWWDDPKYKISLSVFGLFVLFIIFSVTLQSDHSEKFETGEAYVFLENTTDSSSRLRARTTVNLRNGENHDTKDCLLRLRVCKEWIINHLQDETISEIQFSTYNSSINNRVKQTYGLRISYLRGGTQKTIDVESDLAKSQIEVLIEEFRIILNSESN